MDMRHRNLHDMERPVAMLSSLYANSQRDPKKSQKPYNYLDFSFYKPFDTGDTPQGQYGAAYIELVKTKRLPSWALFCYKSLVAGAQDGYVPSEPAFVAEDAILLHPEKVGGGYRGLLIAMETASDKRRVFLSSKGEEIVLSVPFISTKVVAEENVTLTR